MLTGRLLARFGLATTGMGMGMIFVVMLGFFAACEDADVRERGFLIVKCEDVVDEGRCEDARELAIEETVERRGRVRVRGEDRG